MSLNDRHFLSNRIIHPSSRAGGVRKAGVTACFSVGRGFVLSLRESIQCPYSQDRRAGVFGFLWGNGGAAVDPVRPGLSTCFSPAGPQLVPVSFSPKSAPVGISPAGANFLCNKTAFEAHYNTGSSVARSRGRARQSAGKERRMRKWMNTAAAVLAAALLASCGKEGFDRPSWSVPRLRRSATM